MLIEMDWRSLYDVMHFFVGTSPDDSHDDLAAKIAAKGKTWARDHWRREDMVRSPPSRPLPCQAVLMTVRASQAAYMFRLALEWRRVLYRGTAEQIDYAS